MQFCVDEAVSKRRKLWDERALTQALGALRTQSLKSAAQAANVTPDSLRCALARRGVKVRDYRLWVMKKRKPVFTEKPKAFVPAESKNENRPFLAMSVFEKKQTNGCSWPTGDLETDDFAFCDKPRKRKSSYCPECAKLAYKPN